MSQLLHHSIKSDPVIKDSSTGQFMKDVIEASKNKIVLVDFWATWCQPCLVLTPILEKVVESYKGQILLVKINIDQNQPLVQQLRVQSVPMVYAFFQGKALDAFSGVLPENHIRAFITKLIQIAFPDQAVKLAIQQAQYAFDDNQIELATNLFEHILVHNKDNLDALLGLSKCYIRQNKLDASKEVVSQFPDEPKAKNLKKEVEIYISLIEEGLNYKNSSQKIKHPHEKLFQNALVLISEHNYPAALQGLLDLVQKDKEWENQKARKKLIDLFDALGQNSDLTINGRKKLSVLLFA